MTRVREKVFRNSYKYYSDKRMSEKKNLEKLEIRLILSHLVKIKTLTLKKKEWLKRILSELQTAGSS